MLDIDRSISANRTVITFVGNKDSIFKAAWNGIKKADELINQIEKIFEKELILCVDEDNYTLDPQGEDIFIGNRLRHEYKKELADDDDFEDYFDERKVQERDKADGIVGTTFIR